MKKFFRIPTLLLTILFFLSLSTKIDSQTRKDFNLPDVLGYKVLKCDFHMHTIYSDGEVYPPLRAVEAWREGLDAFAITDHIESYYIDNVMPESRNVPYDLAKPTADKLKITLIKGGEISKATEPPGHLNAIFIDDVDKLNHPYYKDGVKAAIDQGGFIFWNHPGWKQPGFKSVWYNQQDTLYKLGWLHGIEVVNGIYYDPIAHQWCLDKHLTMLGNTDAHDPIAYEYDLGHGEHRTMTFVLAKDNSIEAIKDALFNQRTIVYYQNKLVGEEKYLKQLFENSLELSTKEVTFKGRGRQYIFIKNNSSIDYYLESSGSTEEVRFNGKVKLPAGETTIFPIRPNAKGQVGTKEISMPYVITNLIDAPNHSMNYEFKVKANFIE